MGSIGKKSLQKPARDALGRDARRLLAALAESGASPARSDLRDGFLTVAAPRKGVTSVTANAPVSAGDELVARDVAQWAGEGAARKLVLRAEGAALARRLAAPVNVDPYEAQHRSLSVKTIAPGESPVVIDACESPLLWLARRRGRDGAAYLSAAQIEAGGRFHRDVTVAQLLPRVTSDWSGAGGARGKGATTLNVGDLAIAARRRLDRAAHSVGHEFNGLLIDVCGFQKRLALVEHERGWPPRAGKVVLRMALDQLATHYGLASHATGPDRTRATRRWGAADYRPAIDGAE